jgi:hypothetical protein
MRGGNAQRLSDGVFLICLGAAAFNPHGPAILLYPFKTLSIPVLQAYIQEWQSPDFQQANLLPFLAMLVALLVAFGVSRRPATSTEMISIGGWTVFAFMVRNVPIFALVRLHLSAGVGARPRLNSRPSTKRRKDVDC